MYRRFLCILSFSVCLVLPIAAATLGFAAEPYKGKTVRIIVPSSPGGGTDMLARLIARHLGRHVPGNPAFIVQNVTGAGQVIGIAYAFHAKPNGLTMGTSDGSMLTGHLTGIGKDKFDLAKANYIGNPFADNRTLFVLSNTGVKDIREVKGAAKTLNFGASGRGDSKATFVTALKKLGGYNLKVILGYRGTSSINAGVQRGELDGSVMGWINLKSLHQDWLDKNYVTVLVQTGTKRHPELPNVPLLSELVPASSKNLVDAISVPFSIAKPYFVPPGTPKDRIETLRQAFGATMRDPKFLADAKRLRRPITPTTGPELQRTVESILTQPPEVVEELKKITGG